jgi:hypothetical protein
MGYLALFHSFIAMCSSSVGFVLFCVPEMQSSNKHYSFRFILSHLQVGYDTNGLNNLKYD